MKRFALLLALALCATTVSAQKTEPKPLPSDPLQARLARIFDRKEFEAKKFGPFRWMENGKAYTTLEPVAGSQDAKDLVRYDSATGARRVLVPASRLVPAGSTSPLVLEDYAWSDDGKKLLLFANAKKVWRQKTRGDYWLMDVARGDLRRIGASRPEASLMFAKLSPDATRVAYVSANDLWVEDSASGAVTRLTSDGSPTIINGTADWVYEEELSVRDGFRWCPDGRDIAFWRFDSDKGWTRVQDYGPSSTYTWWTPGVTDVGQHALQVWVRSMGSTAAYEGWSGTGLFDVDCPTFVPVVALIKRSWASGIVRPEESSVSRVARLCAVVPLASTVGVWKITELIAPAPVPLPLATVMFPPVLSVPVMPLQAWSCCEMAAPFRSTPIWSCAAATRERIRSLVP